MELPWATLDAVEKFRQAQAAFLSQPDTATDAEFRQAKGEFNRAAIAVAQHLLAAVDHHLMSVQREPATPKDI